VAYEVRMLDTVISILTLCGVAVSDANILLNDEPAQSLLQAEILVPADNECLGREFASLDLDTVLVYDSNGDLVGARYRLGSAD
jgi:hypothetical protein